MAIERQPFSVIPGAQEEIELEIEQPEIRNPSEYRSIFIRRRIRDTRV